MKKLIVCIVFTAALFLIQTDLQAQGDGQKGQMKEMMRQHLKDSLNLSDALVDSVMAIREEMQPKVREVVMDQSLNEDDKKLKMEAIRKEMHDRFIKAGLTEEQVKSLKEMEERMREKKRNKNK
jgi:hypothetical protein